MIPPGWWMEDDKQPGDHMASCNPHPLLVRVLSDPYTGTPYSPRKKFLLYVIVPVLVIAAVMVMSLAWLL